jgi:hypothetical protein
VAHGLFRRIRCGTVDGQRNFPEEQESRWYAGERGYPESDWRDDNRYSGEDYRAADPRTAGEPRRGGRELGGDEGLDNGRESDPLGRSSGFQSWYGDADAKQGAESGRSPEAGYSGGRSAASVLPAQAPGLLGPGGLVDDADARIAEAADSVEPGGRSDEARSMSAPTGTLPPVVEPAPFPQFETDSIERATLRRPGAPAGSAPEGVYRTRRPAIAIAVALLTVLAELPALRLLLTGAFADPVDAPAVVSGTLLMIGLGLFAMGMHALAAGAAAMADPVRFWFRPPTAYLTVGLALFVAAALAVA